MTIIQYLDSKTHWEAHTATITIPDAAGGTANDAGVINFDKAGLIMSFNYVQRSSISNTNTNAQALGMITITDAGFNNINIGNFETGFRLQIHKTVGTSGNLILNYICSFLIRDRG